MYCDNNWFCQRFPAKLNTDGAMVPFMKVKAKGKVDISVHSFPPLFNDFLPLFFIIP